MLRHVDLVRTDVLEDRSSSIIRLARIGGLGRTLAVNSNRRTLQVTANDVPSSPILFTLIMEALRSSETTVLTRATRHSSSNEFVLLFSLCLAGPVLPRAPVTTCKENTGIMARMNI
jgi:hypothetical protein